MKAKLIIGIVVLLGLAVCAYAQDEEARLNSLFSHMKVELNLTQTQADVIKPILAEYAAKRQELEDSLKGFMVIDDSAFQSEMEKLDEEENQKFSQILSPEQMKKWSNKQQMRNVLNRDRTGDAGWVPKDTQTGLGLSF